MHDDESEMQAIYSVTECLKDMRRIGSQIHTKSRYLPQKNTVVVKGGKEVVMESRDHCYSSSSWSVTIWQLKVTLHIAVH